MFITPELHYKDQRIQNKTRASFTVFYIRMAKTSIFSMFLL